MKKRVQGQLSAYPESTDLQSATMAAYQNNATSLAQRYLSIDMSQYYERFLHSLESRERILDAGCGPGRDAQEFWKRGFAVVGLDLTTAFLSLLRETNESIPVVRADMRSAPFGSNTFSGLWSVASILHVPHGQISCTFREFARIVKPGGRLFVSTANGVGVEVRGMNSGVRQFFLYSRDQIRTAVCEAGFEVLDLQVENGVSQGTWINCLGVRKGTE